MIVKFCLNKLLNAIKKNNSEIFTYRNIIKSTNENTDEMN